MRKKRILQMMAADGWWAGFSPNGGNEFALKLICWVLVEEDGETTLQGMCSGGGFSEFCENNKDFDDYIYVEKG